MKAGTLISAILSAALLAGCATTDPTWATFVENSNALRQSADAAGNDLFAAVKDYRLRSIEQDAALARIAAAEGTLRNLSAEMAGWETPPERAAASHDALKRMVEALVATATAATACVEAGGAATEEACEQYAQLKDAAIAAAKDYNAAREAANAEA